NNIFFMTGDYESATKISTEGLAKAEKINDRERMAHFNNVLGCIMIKLKNYGIAEKYFSEELKLGRQTGNKKTEAHAFMNLADHAILVNKNDEAIGYINKALPIYKTFTPPELDKEVYAHYKLSEAFEAVHKNDSALKYCLLAINSVEKYDIGNLYDRASYYMNAGNIYNKLQQPGKALSYLKTGLKLADSIKHRENLRDIYEQFAISYALRKKFDSAYAYQQMFSSLKDSILNENSERDILQKEADLKVEREKRIQEAELSRQRLWRNIIIAGLVFAILITIMLYNRRRIKQQMVYQEQLNKQQNEMFNLAASAQEKERKRIAEDLHDGLGSVLSAAKLKLSALNGDKNLLTGEQMEKYQATLSLLDEASTELRNVSHNIMPATLSKLGLIAALKNVTEKISSHSGLLVELEIHGMDSREDKRLEESIEISVYRIILELLNNIVKHAKATLAVVQLIKYPDYINITVEDNGKGFEYKKAVNEKKGIGLGNIESRVSYLGGTIEVDSRAEKGTVTIIDIPYNSDSKIPWRR
ncbi:MAG: tetratricopeptide repeat-containing sensor histidine kinase, partial [Chitinophagaceae bacterium]